MMLRRILLCIAVLGGVLSAIGSGAERAAAELISEDSDFGPGTITLDTATGFRWLDPSVTAGRTYSGMLAEMAPGGAFHGYQYATDAEWVQFLNDAGIEAYPVSDGFGTMELTSNHAPISALLALIGSTGAILGEPGPFQGSILARELSLVDDRGKISVGGTFDGIPNVHWLRLPEPGAAALGVAVTSALVALRRRRLR